MICVVMLKIIEVVWNRLTVRPKLRNFKINLTKVSYGIDFVKNED